jgi:hypothetical protein
MAALWCTTQGGSIKPKSENTVKALQPEPALHRQLVYFPLHLLALDIARYRRMNPADGARDMQAKKYFRIGITPHTVTVEHASQIKLVTENLWKIKSCVWSLQLN